MAGPSRRNRVIEVDRTKTSAHQEAVLTKLDAGRGRILTPYKIWIHAPEIAEGMEILGTYLNKYASLSYAEVEVVVLSTAVFWGSPFVIHAHTQHALSAGVPQAAVDAIRARKPVRVDDLRLQAVADFVAEALKGASIEDGEYARYEQIFGRRGISELLGLVGYYTSVSLAMRLHEVQPAAE